jgi:RNA polymerase sigma-70 factor (ECF subfamily)
MLSKFEQLHKEFYSEIFQFAFQLSLSKDESKDLLQDAFVKLFREMKKNYKIENPRAWLYKVVLNLWRNKCNKSKNQELLNLKINWQTFNNQSPEYDYIRHEETGIVFNCLNRMPIKDRNILFLYHDGLSYSEIADVLDMPKTSVGKTLSRSINKLKMVLKTEHHELFE